MKIDFQYIKVFLDIVLSHDHPDFKISHKDIKPLWDTDEKLNKLVFHLEILEDEALIESSIGTSGIGFGRMSDGQFVVSVIPLRLTAAGHQFASDLSKPGVFEKVKNSFKDAGPTEAVKVVFALGKKALENQLENLIEWDT